ncbi:MAG: LuxR C-terminal-related transcriptional regulator [Bacteroidaceae bacterium]|nr:LuxR C-terminal-related transcriptional regulator [Bacteroidaceae bacterium]
MIPRFAIINENTLEAVGLKTMLDTIVPMVDVSVYPSFEEFMADNQQLSEQQPFGQQVAGQHPLGKQQQPPAGQHPFGQQPAGQADSQQPAIHFFHYFVSPRILLANSQFFISHQRQTIVLTAKDMASPSLGSYLTLDTSKTEHNLVKALLALHQRGHANPNGSGFRHPSLKEWDSMTNNIPISKREAEVLALVARGFINKEIADRLCISLATVISHRKNICEKLNLHSVSALTIYAVTHGLVGLEEI